MSEYSEDIEMIWNDDGFNELGFPSCRGTGTISDIAWEPHVYQKSDSEISNHNNRKIPWPVTSPPPSEIKRSRNLLIEQIIEKNPSVERASLEKERTRTLREIVDNMMVRKGGWFY